MTASSSRRRRVYDRRLATETAQHMTDRLFDLSGIVAVVIGGTGVLGGALAEALAAAGAAVAIAGRNEERGNARCVGFAAAAERPNFSADASSRESLRAR